RRDVLDEVAARRRRRDHRPDLQGARGEARLRLRRLGLEDGLPRDRDHLTNQRAGEARPLRDEPEQREESGWDSEFASAGPRWPDLLSPPSLGSPGLRSPSMVRM